ncbi:type II toxin-antitoxin system RelE/ParE family toxin [Nostoc sp.]|uniref:type II toxin-antitoxin system RelE/ParE family toxin n=1 Tax=Nostoc sp. TaxID=1180 RepID=UPI002FF6018F
MARVSWTSQALNDLEAIGDFIARDAPNFAQAFVNRVFQSVERLEQFPCSGRVVPEIAQEDIREIIFGNYRIVYSGSRLSEVQEPHPQPPKSKRRSGDDVPHVIRKRYI